MKTRKVLAALGIAGAITGGLALAAPAQATGCSSGYGGWGGGGFCDTDYWRDGSYMHCVNVTVLGFGGGTCNRVCPWPDPGNMAPPPLADMDPRTRC